jgi:hypothetical protein
MNRIWSEAPAAASGCRNQTGSIGRPRHLPIRLFLIVAVVAAIVAIAAPSSVTQTCHSSGDQPSSGCKGRGNCLLSTRLPGSRRAPTRLLARRVAGPSSTNYRHPRPRRPLVPRTVATTPPRPHVAPACPQFCFPFCLVHRQKLHVENGNDSPHHNAD